MDIVGLIPAGGIASRLGNLPCSKEVFPINKDGKINVLSSYLLSYYKNAGINNVFFIIRKGKWDIPQYFENGSSIDMNIGYLIVNISYGTPFTIDQSYEFTKDKIVAMGFPDIVFKPENAFNDLKIKLLNSDSDIVLGVVPCNDYLKSDMIEFDSNNIIKNIVIKQNRPDLKFSWFIALWRPSFTKFMHSFLNDFIKENPDGTFEDPHNHKKREIFVGDVIMASISHRLKVDYVLFPDGHYIDLGTPESLLQF